MIKEYHFGSIIIDGKTYTHDVEVRWTDKVLDWWRKKSHVIDVGDIKRALTQNPEIMVIGTGESGVANVTEEAKKEIEKRGIKLIIDITGEAVKTFNVINPVRSKSPKATAAPMVRTSNGVNEESKEEEGEQAKVIGLFHLTC